jgi:putative transcriptional regulator
MQNMIRTYRLENGWTQQNLANRVGISRLMISLFEHWRRDPSLALAYRLADALGKRIDEVFPHQRQAFAPDEPKATASEPETSSSGATRLAQNQVRPSRVSKRWSQRELAERVGVAMGTINAIERGSWKPSLALAYAISEVLDRSVIDLFPLDAFRKLTPLGPSTSEDSDSTSKDALNGEALPELPRAAGQANKSRSPVEGRGGLT